MGQSQSKRTSGRGQGVQDSSFTEVVRRGLKRVRSFFARSEAAVAAAAASETSSIAGHESKRIRPSEGEEAMATEAAEAAEGSLRTRTVDGLANLSVNDVEERGDAAVENDYLRFPFLTEEKSRKWVSENPVLFVLRGLPGSGKSTVTRAICATYPEATVCSADNFFVNKATGEYEFDLNLLGSAHEESQRSAEEAMASERRGVVVVDNTNVRRWEMGFYIKAAEKHGYNVVVVETKTPWRLDPAVLAEKNSHGVPAEVLRKKVSQFEVVYPMYFAWFMSLVDSQTLLKVTRNLLKDCLEKCDQFRKGFEELSGLTDEEAMLRFFNRRNCLDSNKKIVHCTAKFCGNDKDSAKKYCKRTEVAESLGKAFDLKIIGYVITKGTFGARIMLDEEELKVYDQNENNVDEERKRFESFNNGRANSGKPSVKERLRMAEEAAEVERLALDSSTMVASSMTFTNRYYPIPGRGKRAHVTLGTSGNTKPVVTGLDVMRAVEAERVASEKEVDDVPTYHMENGDVLRQYEPDLWVLYLNKAVTFDAMFTGHY